jgi:hypothetical protein
MAQQGAPPQAELGLQQVVEGSKIVLECREPDDIFLDADGLAGLEAEFEIDVDELQEELFGGVGVLSEEVSDIRRLAVSPAGLEAIDGLFQGGGEGPDGVMGAGHTAPRTLAYPVPEHVDQPTEFVDCRP